MQLLGEKYINISGENPIALFILYNRTIRALTKLHNQYMIRTEQVNEKILRGWVKRHGRHSLPAVTVRDP